MDQQKKPDVREETQEQTIDEQVPEMRQLGLAFQLLSFFGINRVSKKVRIAEAIDTLQRKSFQHDLLKLFDQNKFQSIINAHEIARKAVEKKRQKGEYETEVGFWKFKRRISSEEFDRKSQALEVAKEVRKHVSAAQSEQAIQETVKRFGLENGENLRVSLADRQTKNPKLSFQGNLFEEWRSMRQGEREKQSWQERQQAEKELKQEFSEMVRSARTETVEREKERIISAQEDIADILRGKTSDQGSQAFGKESRINRSRQENVEQQHLRAPREESVRRQFSQNISNARNRSIQELWKRIRAGQQSIQIILGQMGRLVSGGIRSILRAGAVRSFAFAAKTAAKLGLTALTGGAYKVASAALGAIKYVTLGYIDVETLLWKTVKFALIIICGIIIGLPILLMLIGSSHVFTNSKPQAVSFLNTPTDNARASWEEFETVYLGRNDQGEGSATWRKFEAEYLMIPQAYLSQREE